MMFKVAGATDRSDVDDLQRRLHQRRQAAHVDIPTDQHLRAMLGERIEEVLGLLVRHDPAELVTWRSFDRKHPRHIENLARQYRPLANTLAYRMDQELTYPQLKEAFSLELRLWFGDRPFLAVMSERPTDMIPTLYRWRQSWGYR